MPLRNLINRSSASRVNEDFNRLVAENHRNVYALALRLTGSAQDAEDITQEVFMKFYKSQSSFRGDSKVTTLLYRITYNHSIDFLRRKRPKSCELREEITSEQADELTHEQKMQILESAIAKLSIEDQAIITLFYTDNRSIEEISQIATISIANVKVRLHRIRKKLHAILKKEYYE
ncbi:MAG: RNA polymerase sigma factor [Rikenellaceae bacterium]